MITYNLGENVIAFSSDRTEGRDPQLLCPALDVPDGRFYRPHQVHGTEIEVLTPGNFTPAIKGNTCDAVIYNVRNACIGISTADCIPVICYDPEHHCAAAIHAGWRGTVARIVEKAIEKMQEVYSTDPTLLRCAIGPGISMESFEVGDEVYEAFCKEEFIMDRIAKRYTKWHIDLKECNRMQLLSQGVIAGNIIVSPIDTMTDSRFFSARREGIKTGRLLTGIVLR